jgi:hypothetical protein
MRKDKGGGGVERGLHFSPMDLFLQPDTNLGEIPCKCGIGGEQNRGVRNTEQE